jgi:hypothetical protein
MSFGVFGHVTWYLMSRIVVVVDWDIILMLSHQIALDVRPVFILRLRDPNLKEYAFLVLMVNILNLEFQFVDLVLLENGQTIQQNVICVQVVEHRL